MRNNDEINISKISYTNKDFASLYPEVLDIAKQLTNKWDPSQSNESDPGVVLLKEAAFVADHNNYNIDKNILEAFLPSATQDRSVRNIAEMNGYTPKYYYSANGYVTFNWSMTDEEYSKSGIPETGGLSMDPFTLVISDPDNSITYTQSEPLTLVGENNKKLSGSCRFIQGTIQEVSVNNSNIIGLENLDENNRLYLPETMIAENGIYVRYVNSEDHNEYGYWKNSPFIMTNPSGSRVFRFDYDSMINLPYIEFPDDISNIIGEGLNIKYISTFGENGNIGAGKLTKIISPSFIDDWDLTHLTLSNPGEINNGRNPENIDEIYRSFRKTVGTFDTLVTCQDYANYIYNLEDGYGNPLVSNVYVTDRRTDYNHALNVITYDNNGTYFRNISLDGGKLTLRGAGTAEYRDSVVKYPEKGDMWCLTDDWGGNL